MRLHPGWPLLVVASVDAGRFVLGPAPGWILNRLAWLPAFAVALLRCSTATNAPPAATTDSRTAWHSRLCCDVQCPAGTTFA